MGGHDMPHFKVTFQPVNLSVDVLAGSTVKDALNGTELDFDFPCGGTGKCGKCRVRIIDGMVQPTSSEKEILEAEEIAEGIYLACLTKVENDLTVELPNYKKHTHNILMASDERYCRIEPHLKKVFLQPEPPSLDDPRDDWQRVRDTLTRYGYDPGRVEAPLAALQQLPEMVREAEYHLTAVMHGHKLLGIEQLDTTGTMLGMAFDIGTTTIVGYLLEAYSGKELSVVSTLNPQTKFGADVISRITFAGQEEDGLKKLHISVIGAINRLIGEAVEKAGVSRNDIYEICIAANTCMHHLFLGISPRNIALAPYVPAVSGPVVAKAADLAIKINQAGRVFVLPNIAGFVGADTTAVLLAAELDRSADIKLVIDIGTNGEIALGSQDKVVACSAAAGPAFEGAQISSGMRGAVGAIDHVYFADGLAYSVIGGAAPLGLCGSALLDTVAGLLELGIIDKRGRILPFNKLTNPAAKVYKDHLVQHEGSLAFLLADSNKTGHGRPIMVTQADIREVQLAKGAMAAGVRVLMEACGIQTEEIKEVLLAGAFGNYLNPHSACVIGLIPQELESKIKMIGNAAGSGAKIALLSSGEYRRAAEVAKRVRFIELGSYPKFNSIFGECTYFSSL